MDSRMLPKLMLLLGGLLVPLGFVAGLTPSSQQVPLSTSEKDKEPVETNFELLDAQVPLVVQIPNDLKEEAAITVINNGESPIEIEDRWLSVTLKDDSGHAFPEENLKVEITPKGKLNPHEQRVFQISLALTKPFPKFKGRPFYASQSLTGYLFFRAGKTVKQRPLQLVPFHSSPQVAWLIWIPLGVAVLIGLISLWRLREKLGKRMVFPEWTSSSWMTNLTVVGAVLTTTTSAIGAVKQPQLLQLAEYTVLSVLFGALVLIAPLAYNSIRLAQDPNAGPSYGGYVWLFIATITFTLWGAFGQFLLIYYYFDEVAKARLISRSGSLMFNSGIALVGLLLCVYAARTIYFLATQPTKPEPSATGVGETPVSAPGVGETPVSVPGVGETPASAAGVRETPASDRMEGKQRQTLL